MEPINLKGKVAVVTGGRKGLGGQIIHDFAAAGADVVIASRNFAKCEEAAHDVEKMGVKALPIKCDVANLADIDYMYAQVMQEFGRVNILVNNAGIYRTMPDIGVTEEDWDAILNVNLKGLFFCSQKAAKIMIEQKGGKIINLASATGIKPMKRMTPYTVSKAGVIHITKSLALEWARYNIQINAIAPGIICTDINADELGNEEIYNKTLKTIPARRYGEPTDIANVAVFLAADASNYITGQTFTVDGGMILG